MKFLLYLIMIAALTFGIYWFIKTVFDNSETKPTAAAAQTQGQAAAQDIGNSINQNSSPINKTKLMQRVNNVNDQHNQAVSKQ